MGEKVQIFVRLQDRNLKTIAEFALHEPYGGGIFSAMNALHLALNVPNGYQVTEKPVFTGWGLNNFKKAARQHNLDMKQMAIANDLYSKVTQAMAGTKAGMYWDAFNGTPEEIANKFMSCGSQKQVDDLFNNLRRELYSKGLDEDTSWDNQDGYVMMTVRYSGTGSSLSSVNSVSIRFYNHNKQQITIKQFIGNELLATNYANLVKNLGINLPNARADAADENEAVPMFQDKIALSIPNVKSRQSIAK